MGRRKALRAASEQMGLRASLPSQIVAGIGVAVEEGRQAIVHPLPAIGERAIVD
jgi:hypothetical protein